MTLVNVGRKLTVPQAAHTIHDRGAPLPGFQTSTDEADWPLCLCSVADRQSGTLMIVSGILVMTAPQDLASVRRAIDALNWADTHHVDSAGRMIVTLEAEHSEQGQERLKELKHLPGVISAEMVLHCFEDEALEAPPPDPNAAAEILNQDDGQLPRRSYYSRLKAVGNH